MKEQIASIVLALSVLGISLPVFADGHCAVTPADLVGSWQRSSQSGFFELMSLSNDAGEQAFNSWLHNRPELVDASWSLVGCVLAVTQTQGELGPFRFRVAFDGNVLVLTDVDSGQTGRYRPLAD